MGKRMKYILLALIAYFFEVSAQELKLSKIASSYGKVARINISSNDEIICTSSMFAGSNYTIMLDTLGHTLVEANKIATNFAAGKDGFTVFTNYLNDSITFDFKGYLENKNKAIAIEGLRHPLDLCMNCLEYIVDDRNNIYSRSNIQAPILDGKPFSVLIKKPLDRPAIQIELSRFKYGFLNNTVFRRSTQELYAFFDSVMVVLDTNLTVLREKPRIEKYNYKLMRELNDSALVGVFGNSIKVFDYDLNLKRSFSTDSIFTDIEVDSKKNIYLARYHNSYFDIYKATFEDVVTSLKNEEAIQTPILSKTDYGYEVSVKDFERIEIYDMQGKKEVHHSADFTTSLSGILIFNIFTKSGQNTQLRLLAE